MECVFRYLFFFFQRVTSELRVEGREGEGRRGGGVGGLLTNRKGHRVEEGYFERGGFFLRLIEGTVLYL